LLQKQGTTGLDAVAAPFSSLNNPTAAGGPVVGNQKEKKGNETRF